MKPYLFLVMGLCLQPAAVFGQNASPPTTDHAAPTDWDAESLELVAAITGLHDSHVKIASTLTLSDTSNQPTDAGRQVLLELGGRPSCACSTALVLSGEESDELLEGLDDVIDFIDGWNGTEDAYTQLVFSVDERLEVKFHVSSRRVQGYIRSLDTDRTTAYLDRENLTSLHNLLASARATLEDD